MGSFLSIRVESGFGISDYEYSQYRKFNRLTIRTIEKVIENQRRLDESNNLSRINQRSSDTSTTGLVSGYMQELCYTTQSIDEDSKGLVSHGGDIIDTIDIGGVLVRLVHYLRELDIDLQSRDYGYTLRILS